MKNDTYIRANQAMWNQTADVYNAEGFSKLLSIIGQPEFTTFDEVERRVFSGIGLKDKDVAQLGCNNGRELVSVKKAGAGRCVGFDLSENFIKLARRLALESGQELEFVRTSVYDVSGVASVW